MATPEVPKQRGRTTPGAARQTRGAQGFGGDIAAAGSLPEAPVGAFGNTKGQLAIANALQNAGNTLFDIGVREQKLQQAEDETQLKRMKTKLNLEEQKTQLALNQEQEEYGWAPDEKYEEYKKRIESKRNEIRGNYQFKTISDDTVNFELDTLVEERDVQYNAGQIQADRTDAIKAHDQEVINSYVEQATLLGQNRDAESLSQLVSEINDYTSSTRFVAQHGRTSAESIAGKAVQTAITSFVKEVAEVSPKDAKELLEEEESPLRQVLTDEELSVMREDLQAIIVREQNVREREENKRQEKLFGTLDLGIVEGAVGKSDIMNASLDDDRKATLLRRLDSNRTKMTTEQENYREIETLLKNEGTYVQEGKSKQKVVDDWYNLRVQELSEADPQVAFQTLSEEVSQVGVMPTMLRGIIEGGLNSGDPEKAQQAAQYVLAIERMNPRATMLLPEETRAMSHLLSVGIPLEQVNEKLERVSQMTEVERKAWRTQAKDDVEGFAEEDKIQNLVEETFDWSGFDPDIAIPVGARSDFEALYEHNLIMTQSSAAAWEMTQKQWLRTWTRTSVDGDDRLMKYAPELMYRGPRDTDVDWMRKQLQQDMATFGYEQGDYRIVVDRSTIGKPGGVKYFVSVNGIPLRKQDGSPKRWFPNRERWFSQQIEDVNVEREQARQAGRKFLESDTGLGAL